MCAAISLEVPHSAAGSVTTLPAAPCSYRTVLMRVEAESCRGANMGRTGVSFVIVAVCTPILWAVPPRCVDNFSWTHVTAADPTHRALLRQGFERSATFRQLIVDINASSWLVFVHTGRCPEKLNVACLLHFVGAFAGRPYLRVIVRHGPRHPDNVIAVLAHELQHAREVVQAVGIKDSKGLSDLFQRIGRVSVARPGVVTYETDDALRIGEVVLHELIQTPPRGCP
jgi:hypothetical protein